MGLMIGLLMAGVGSARQRFLVRDAAQQFASDVRQAISDTKNGIKEPTCTSSNANNHRECSNYQLILPYDGMSFKKVVVNNDSPSKVFPNPAVSVQLPKGVKFAGYATLFFKFSTESFPLVDISSDGGSIPYTSNAYIVTIVSQTNASIKTNVCIYKSGTVVVQTAACT
jgi:hypothetical protein